MKLASVILVVCLLVLLVPAGPDSSDVTAKTIHLRPPIAGLLDRNFTASGLNVSLYAPEGPPFYTLWEYQLMVFAFKESLDPFENISVSVEMGMDSLGPPGHEEAHCFTSIGPHDGLLHGWYYNATLTIEPTQTNSTLLAQLTHGNETVNLTYEMIVLPPRSLLVPKRLLPPNHTGDPELKWTSLEILIENKGGPGATDLVVDLIYMGRILGTHEIPVIVGGGNRTISTSIMPVYHWDEVTVKLVKGPDAPLVIGNVSLEVVARPILDVLEIVVKPDSIESGEKVHIEALVANRGNSTTDGQMVELMVDGSVVANESIVGMWPGNTTTVQVDWELRGEGVHSISAIAEGDDLAASPVAVEVKAPSPSVGVWAALLALALVSLAARRSRSGGRA